MPRYEWTKFFLVFFLFFVFLHKSQNSQAYTPIQLQFDTLVGHSMAIISTNFGENLYKMLRVIISHLHKTRTIFRHVYKVNCWLNQPENWYVARFNIRGYLLVVRNECSKRQQRYEARPNLGKNYAIDFCVIENYEFQPLSDKPHGRISWKLLWF